MKIHKIEFPIYVIGTEEIEERDGVLFADSKVVDDKNMSGDTLGVRRLQTSLPNLYPLRYMLEAMPNLMRHRGYNYIDNKGNLFSYMKEKFYPMKYHKIVAVDKKDSISLLWLEDINFPIEVPRPPAVDYRWAAVIYRNNLPWFFYEYSTEWKKNTKRKV